MNFLSSLSKIKNKLLFRFPSKLPYNRQDFDAFCTLLFKTYDFPQKEEYVNAVATRVMHLDQIVQKKAKYYFVKVIRNAMARQAAYDVLTELRKAEKKRQEEQSSRENSSDENPVSIT